MGSLPSATLRDIQYGAFFNTTKLRTINAKSPVAPDIEASPFATTVLSASTLYCPEGTWFDYQYHWRRFQRVYEYGCGNSVVVGSLKYIVLSNKDRLVSLTGNKYTGDVVIPESVTIDGNSYSVAEIGCFAFDGNTAITSVSIPATVKVINNYAFRKSALPSLSLPAGLRMLKEGCFQYAPIPSVQIPPRIVRIENLVFDNCAKLTVAELNDSVTYLGNSAFAHRPELTTVNGGKNIVTLMESVFLNDVKLSRIELPNVVTIKGAAFRQTTVNFKFPKSLRVIELQGFMECSGLTDVVLPDTMDQLGTTAFASCPNLTSIKFPKVVNDKMAAATGILQNNPKLTIILVPAKALASNPSGEGFSLESFRSTQSPCPYLITVM